MQRAYRVGFPDINPKTIPHQKQFERVLNRFEASGDISDVRPNPKREDCIPQADVQAVRDFFTENEEAHIRQGYLLKFVRMDSSYQ